MEAEKADVFDSDFNDSESDGEDGSDDEMEAKRSQKKETAANVFHLFSSFFLHLEKVN